MVKKYAHKETKEIVTDVMIKEKSLSKSDYTSNWLGRIVIFDAEKSEIAKQINIKKKGEYAIKVK